MLEDLRNKEVGPKRVDQNKDTLRISMIDSVTPTAE